jgi:uncharacterized protein YdaU (DUF1376 family)
MADFPALPLWTDAYLGDTRHLSQAEHGAYLLLLITAWRTHDCSLPDNDRLLARYACCDMRTWHRQKPTIMAFWNLHDGRWTQKRLSAERKYVAERSSKRAEAGSRGGRASAVARNSVFSKNKGLQHGDAGFAEDKRRGEPDGADDKSLIKIESGQAKLDGLLQQNASTHTHTHTHISTLEDKSSNGAGAPSSDKRKRLYDLGTKSPSKKNGFTLNELGVSGGAA